MYMKGHFDGYGNPYTQIVESARTLFVQKSPLELLEFSMKCTGNNLKGAIESSKWLLNCDKMCPLLVNPLQRIVLFPTRSPKHEENIWFNPHHIKRTTGTRGQTTVQFSNGTSIDIPQRLSSFNSKIQTAEQLEKITAEMAKGFYTMVLDPGKRMEKK